MEGGADGRKGRAQTALDVLETWIVELRNAPQATMRESVEQKACADSPGLRCAWRSAPRFHCRSAGCSAAAGPTVVQDRGPDIFQGDGGDGGFVQAKRGFNKVWARAIRSLPSDKESDMEEDGRRRFDFDQVAHNPPVLLGRIPWVPAPR
jgi:hypothetical protein